MMIRQWFIVDREFVARRVAALEAQEDAAIRAALDGAPKARSGRSLNACCGSGRSTRKGGMEDESGDGLARIAAASRECPEVRDPPEEPRRWGSKGPPRLSTARHRVAPGSIPRKLQGVPDRADRTPTHQTHME